MINLQREFLQFHDNIKLSFENAQLAEKRDLLLDILKQNICCEASLFSIFNQGSYAMHTGIKPEDSDYDIDVGLSFNINKNDYTDCTVVKKWVYDALATSTRNVEIRRSCVTVQYQKEKEPFYHIDFAVYAGQNDDEKLYIAKGKEFSSKDNKIWEPSDPKGLIENIQNRFEGDDAKQFRRVIRYLKKWKNHNFPSTGNCAPTGIALTVLAYNLFTIEKSRDWSKQTDTYNDFVALLNLAINIRSTFTTVWNSDDNKYYHSISVSLPVEPYNNLFEKMTGVQTEEFYQKIDKLISDLGEVKSKDKRSEACTILIRLFGENFPLTVDKSVVGTSESANEICNDYM